MSVASLDNVLILTVGVAGSNRLLFLRARLVLAIGQFCGAIECLSGVLGPNVSP